jgi:long-chain-fatty-acid--[acyl-carrier-protein] ligase
MGRFLVALGRILLRFRYRISVEGLREIASKGTSGILFLPNHPALIDPAILLGELFSSFRPESVADQDQIAVPWVRALASMLGSRALPDPAKYGEAARAEIGKVLRACAANLGQGGNLLFYPGGRLMRGRLEDLGGNSGLQSLLEQAPGARIVLVRCTGLWGSSFSRAEGHQPQLGQALSRGLLTLLGNLVFFVPRRRVRILFEEAVDLPIAQGRQALNRRLEAFYNQDAAANTYVPRFFWERGRSRTCPEPGLLHLEGDLAQVADSIRLTVLAKLRKLSGLEQINDAQALARDLGFDSLQRLELQVWLASEFACAGGDPELIQTVGDVLLAAAGTGSSGTRNDAKPVPRIWQEHTLDLAPSIPEGSTVASVFLKQAARDPHRAVLADANSGVKTYRDVITAIYVLAPILRKLPGPYVGIMLPASVGGAILFLAAQFAGKTPVMVNWTVGVRSMAHSLDLLNVRHVLTAGPLLARLEAQGLDLQGLRERFILLDEIGPRISTFRKLTALLKSHLGWAGLRRVKVPDVAVVLFTSGSENLPKAVPLTQANLLANLRDITQAISFKDDDRFLGFLPPFHSFGLTTTVLLPLLAGMRVAFHPNPTEARALARTIESHGCTLLVGTPTFLHAIARVATDAQLRTLRICVTGAEKCPGPLYETLARRWPHMVVLEGYGITECSPVVSVNRADAPKPCTIGKLLPSVDHAVVDLERGQRLATGQEGMLLVRGPSIFPGYLNYDGPSPFTLFEGKQWYRTGDLVREDAEGTLTFAGRLKRFVKLGGEMVSLPAIEETLNNRFDLEEDTEPVLAVEATPAETNPEVVLFTVKGITREEANGILKAAGLSAIHNIRIVKRLEAIPLLGTGKTDYRALKESLSVPTGQPG